MNCIEALNAAKASPGKVGAKPISYSDNGIWWFTTDKRNGPHWRYGGKLWSSPSHNVGISTILAEWEVVPIGPPSEK